MRPTTGREADLVRIAADLRGRVFRARLGRILAFGVAVSAVIHICVLIWLAVTYRAAGEERAGAPIAFEFTLLPDDELTELDPVDLSDLTSDPLSEAADAPLSPETELLPMFEAPTLDVGAGIIGTLGSAGAAAGGGGLSGGSGSASFFGITARGSRFAYIVDRSGSMGLGSPTSRMQQALEELGRSVQRLPDHASFFVVFFSTGTEMPPMQRGWLSARRAVVDRFVRWLREVTPEGGTQPGDAFRQVFELSTRPDVIFFMTDGEIPPDTARYVAQLNAAGRRVIVNTIAFGDPSSQHQLREIADESGGVYRYVAPSGR
ncbi:MAG: VWA domain-containing protein [Phycisphaeraceae bacterium]|nr:VWA domain-containing protein [Phycisphaeraceae bacterium]